MDLKRRTSIILDVVMFLYACVVVTVIITYGEGVLDTVLGRCLLWAHVALVPSIGIHLLWLWLARRYPRLDFIVQMLELIMQIIVGAVITAIAAVGLTIDEMPVISAAMLILVGVLMTAIGASRLGSRCGRRGEPTSP